MVELHVADRFARGLRGFSESREDSNFTYALTPRCQINFIAGLSNILNQSPDVVKKYLDEIQDDAEFKESYRRPPG